MKLRDLERHLRKHGARKVAEGARHSKWRSETRLEQPLCRVTPRSAQAFESTVQDAMFRDYICLVLDDCTAEPLGSDLPRTNHEASLLNIETLFGWVSSSHALIDALTPNAKLVSAQ